MAVPKSTVKSLSASHSNNSAILNNHPHPHLHKHHHLHHHHPHPHVHAHVHPHITTHPKYHANPVEARSTDPDDSSASNSSRKSSEDLQKEVTDHTLTNNKNPTSWDIQDDLLLRHLKEVRKFGWKEISKYFINRTPNACQFRWRRLKSGNLKTNHTVAMDIYSIDTNTILKNMGIEKSLPDLKDPSINDDDTAILLPQVEITSDTTTSSTKNKNKNNTKETRKNLTKNQFSDEMMSPHSRAYIEESTNIKLSASTTMLQNEFIASSNVNTSTTTINNNNSTTSSSNNNNTTKYGMRKSLSSISVPNFAKPRSFSLNVTRPNFMINTNNPQQNMDVFQSEEENIGFIPKIVVKSRRSSFNTNNTTNATLLIPNNIIPGLTISRRNSNISQSRRPSFNLSINSTSTSRRSSFNFTNHFIDAQQNINSNDKSNSNNIQGFTKWNPDDDKLLLDLINVKNLNLKELSILLPNRSEKEIKWRFQYLSRDKSISGHHDDNDNTTDIM